MLSRLRWEDACRRFFIRPDGSGRRWRGMHRGLRVQVDRDLEWIRFFFDPPLDLGLELREKLVPRRSGAGKQKVVTGDVDFDRRVHLLADEPERAAVLFTTDVRRAFLEAHELAHLTMRDDRLNAVLTLRWRDRIDDVFRRLADIRSALETSRALVAPPRALAAQLPAWSGLAERCRRPLWLSPLRLSAKLDGYAIELSTRRVGRGRHRFEVRATASTPLGLGLTFAPESILSPVASVIRGRDHELGRPELDRRFVVRFAAARPAKEIFDEGLCDALERLAPRLLTLRIDDAAAVATGDCVEADALGAPEVVQSLVGIQERLRANLRRGRKTFSRPYR